MTIGHAFNAHCGVEENSDIIAKQRKVAIVTEMIQTASLYHDDVLALSPRFISQFCFEYSDVKRDRHTVTCHFPLYL